MSFLSFVFGQPETDTARTRQDHEFPRPIEFVEALKAAMRDNLLDVTETRAIVPGHFTVLLHAEAYRFLEPALPVIVASAGEELTAEVERLCHVPFGAPAHAPAGGNRAGPEGAEGEEARRDVRPLTEAWSIEFVPVLNDPEGNAVRHGYIGIATTLTPPARARVVDEEGAAGASLTVVHPFSGGDASRPATSGALPADRGTEGVTLRAPFAGAGEGAGREAPAPARVLAVLSYRYPGSPEEHTFLMTEPEILVGRRTPTNDHVHLRLDVDVQVSAEHALIRHDAPAGRFEILDLSSYGTWVDEVALTPSDPAGGVLHAHELRDGAHINLAGYLFLTFRATHPNG